MPSIESSKILVPHALAAMEYWADYWTQAHVTYPETMWFAAPDDNVLATVGVKAYRGDLWSRTVLVSQCLGPDASSGGVAYGVRRLKGGPLVAWAAGARLLEEVTFINPKTSRHQSPDARTLVAMSLLVRNAANNLREEVTCSEPWSPQVSTGLPGYWLNELNYVVMNAPEA